MFYTFTNRNANSSLASDKPNAAKDIWAVSSETHQRHIPKFVVVAHDTMKESDIINNYYHMIASIRLKYFSMAYRTYLYNNFQLGGTCILSNALQSYVLAYNMKQNGVQNVTCITISDGGNTMPMYELPSSHPADYDYATAVECPFTGKIHSINYQSPASMHRCLSFDSRLLSPLNRMTREAGIKTYNLFLSNELRSYFASQLNVHADSHDEPIKLSPTSSMREQLARNSYCRVKNLSFYNEVIYIDSTAFPALIGKSSENGDDADPLAIIKNSHSHIKKLAKIGELIADIMLEDFKI